MKETKYNNIQTIEEISLNALPSLQQILYDGWVLRFADGYTKRANSINPIYPSSQNLKAKIARCEQIYGNFNLKPIFRLANIPRLENLDSTLEQSNYQKKDSVSVRVNNIANRKTAKINQQITLSTELSQEWLDYLVHGVELPIMHWETLATMLQIIPNQTCYAFLKDNHRFCSCGLGVLEDQYLGLFFITTAKQQRRRGYAEQLISRILDWGKSNGAQIAYLQVEINNQAAINLYNKLGFSETYQYFYRIKA
jgi:N-acetylglutamate synthase